jgi:Zn-dependent protease
MFRTRVQLGRLFGIPFKIDASWLLIFVWVTWSMGASYIPTAYPELSAVATWLLAGLTALLFFGSVLLHELGHALVARRQGTPVRDITCSSLAARPNWTRSRARPAKSSPWRSPAPW